MGREDHLWAELERVQALGYCRACSAAPSLRRMGVDVLMVQTPRRSLGRTYFHAAPWAPRWAVDLFWRMRGLGIHLKDRLAAFKEAKRLGRAGPLAEAAIVAGIMGRRK